jgi:hypothetical protein
MEYTIEQQIEYANRLLPYGIKAFKGDSCFDCPTIQIDAFTLYSHPITVERKSIVKTEKITLDGYSVDLALRDGEVDELGDFEDFFEAIERIAIMLIHDRILNFAETVGLAEACRENEEIKVLLTRNPSLLKG